jgi:hypothetical protein
MQQVGFIYELIQGCTVNKQRNWPFIITVTMGPTRTAELSALSAGRCLPPRKFLCTRFCFRLSGTQGGQKGQVTRIFPRTLQEIEPGTSRLGAQCLIRLHRSPVVHCEYVLRVIRQLMCSNIISIRSVSREIHS